MCDVYKTLLDESEDFVGFDLNVFSHAASVEFILFLTLPEKGSQKLKTRLFSERFLLKQRH